MENSELFWLVLFVSCFQMLFATDPRKISKSDFERPKKDTYLTDNVIREAHIAIIVLFAE